LACRRGHLGLSAQALAEAAGVSRLYVTQIETGSRVGTARTLAKLARVLDVPVGALLP
jgi:transcriptional regulator with XRE-family HTH domain